MRSVFIAFSQFFSHNLLDRVMVNLLLDYTYFFETDFHKTFQVAEKYSLVCIAGLNVQWFWVVTMATQERGKWVSFARKPMFDMNWQSVCMWYHLSDRFRNNSTVFSCFWLTWIRRATHALSLIPTWVMVENSSQPADNVSRCCEICLETNQVASRLLQSQIAIKLKVITHRNPLVCQN